MGLETRHEPAHSADDFSDSNAVAAVHDRSDNSHAPRTLSDREPYNVSTEFKAVTYGNCASFEWPQTCAACGKAAGASLKAKFAATSEAKFLGVYASWNSQTITVTYPVCRTHQLVYLIPTILTTMSLGHTVLLALVALAAIGGLFGLARMALGVDQIDLSGLKTYVALLIPGAIVLASRVLVPVRIEHFSPPQIWIRIRRSRFAEEFSELNPTATKTYP